MILWDRQNGTRTQINATGVAHSPVLSDDGSIVGFAYSTSSNAFQIYYRNMATMQLRRLTETPSGSPSAKDHSSSSIVVDPAGEFILFDSADDNLAPDDRNQATDIFIHKIASGQTRLISRTHPAAPAFTPVGMAGITNFCLSADGNRLLFFSSDSNLVPGDTNGWPDAFLRDLRTGQTFALSTNTAGGFGATNSVLHGVLSANGRFALLGLYDRSSRSEFPIYAATRIVRKDLNTGQTVTVASNTAVALTFPNIPPFAFSMSADGRWVVYPSNSVVMLADLQSGSQTNLTPLNAFWNEPLITGDGRYVAYVRRSGTSGTGTLEIRDTHTGQQHTVTFAYVSGATFNQNSDFIVYGAPAGQVLAVYAHSIVGRSNVLVCTNCANAAVSADARFIVYQKDVSGLRQIEMKDMRTGATTLVSRSIDGAGAASSDATVPVISGDGRFVAYTSKATNLTADVPNGWNNLYIYDRFQGATIRITGSRGNAGYGSGSASRPVLGPDGRTLVFQSFAGDFVANDFNDTRDLFLLKLGQSDPDNDHDGMSDFWEQAYFNTTGRNGSGDFDQDGQTDLAEYLAGTDPTSDRSTFEVLTITSVSTGQRQLIWRAEPGKSYRMEYKSALEGRHGLRSARW